MDKFYMLLRLDRSEQEIPLRYDGINPAFKTDSKLCIFWKGDTFAFVARRLKTVMSPSFVLLASVKKAERQIMSKKYSASVSDNVSPFTPVSTEGCRLSRFYVFQPVVVLVQEVRHGAFKFRLLS